MELRELINIKRNVLVCLKIYSTYPEEKYHTAKINPAEHVISLEVLKSYK
jgi:hypothetical protein